VRFLSLIKLVKLVVPILILAAGIGIFQVLKATRPEQAPPQLQERVWRVETERVRPKRLAPELTLYGRVETPDLLQATAPAAAWVTEVSVRDGQRVRADQVLLRLDDRDFRPRIAQAEAEVGELRALIKSEKNRRETDLRALEQERRLLDIASDGVERQRRLKTQKVGAEQALDEAEQAQAQQALAVSNREMGIADHPARLQALEARLEKAEAGLEQLRLEYERATTRAPYDAIIAGVDVTTGDQVARGTVLLRLYALDALEIRARIPAPYQDELILSLAEGRPLTATASVAERRLALELSRIAGEADPSGVDGLFQVTEGAELLRLGQMLTLRLRRAPQPDAVPLPYEAVYGGERIYTLVDGRMRGIEVEDLGAWHAADGTERLLVRSPALADGDQVIITHMPNAIDGLRVETINGDDSGQNVATDARRPPR
jgi:multidrug efflux pump subunit AcrA (membrane-fusion protein)